MLLLHGDEGIGKTRFLKEVGYLLRMRGREVYSIEINPSNSGNLMPITEILRLTFKDTPKNIIEKYAKEFISILPEIETYVRKQFSK